MKRTLCILTLIICAAQAMAQSGQWLPNNSGNWGDATKWQGGTIANGTDNTAGFGGTLTTARTVTNDAPRTIGHINATNTTANNYIIGASANALILDTSAGASTIYTSNNLTFTAPVIINDGLQKTGAGALSFQRLVTLGGAQTWTLNAGGTVASTNVIDNAGFNLTVSNAVSLALGTLNQAVPTLKGSGNLTKTGAAYLSLGGTNSLFTGSVTINDGVMVTYQDPNVFNGNLKLDGGIISLYWNSTWTRTPGTGNNQIQVYGNSGIGEQGGTVGIFNFGTLVVWGALGEGSATGYFNPTVFQMGDYLSPNPNATTELQGGLDFNGATRTIKANKTTNANGGINVINIITNSTGTAGMIKTGTGILQAHKSITLNGLITVQSGTLRMGNGQSTGGNGFIRGGASVRVESGALFQHNTFSISTTINQNYNVSGGGTWLKTSTGQVNLTGTNTVPLCIVSNSAINANAPLVFSGKELRLYSIANININGTNVIADTSDVQIITGNAGADVPLITFGTGAGRVETVRSLRVDGVYLTPGTWGKAGSGATFTNNDVFANTNGVINITGFKAVVVGGKLLQVGGKAVVK